MTRDRSGRPPTVLPRLPILLWLALGSAACAQDGEKLAAEAWEHYDRGEFPQAIEKFEKSAAAGFAKAALNLGILFDQGKATTRDRGAAFEWFKKGAELGSAGAMHNVGYYHETGQGGAPEDPAKALEWYLKGAEAGLADSQYSAGLLYHKGKGVERDDAKALELLKLAAKQDHAEAKICAGELEREMSGAQTIAASPSPLPGASPAAGSADPDPEKLFRRGMALLKKPGLGADERKKALKLIAAAATRGHLEAQYTMGVIFIKGMGVTRNEARGRTWLKRAADKGHAKAAKALQVLDSRQKDR